MSEADDRRLVISTTSTELQLLSGDLLARGLILCEDVIRESEPSTTLTHDAWLAQLEAQGKLKGAKYHIQLGKQ